MKLPGGGYAPKDNGAKPGTPPNEPAGASSAHTATPLGRPDAPRGQSSDKPKEG